MRYCKNYSTKLIFRHDCVCGHFDLWLEAMVVFATQKRGFSVLPLKTLVEKIKALYAEFLLRWAKLPHPTQTLPQFLWRAVLNYLRVGSQQAAMLAYYALFSVFPLILLLAISIGSLVGPAVAQEQIANGLKLFLPESTVTFIQGTLTDALSQSAQFGIVALLGLIWAATGLFSGVTRSLDEIFVVSTLRSMWRMRLLALLMGLTLVVLVLASFVTSGILRLFSALSLELNVWLTIGTLFLPLGLNLVIFALLFRYVPARHVQWDAVWPAAIFGAVGWEVAKTAFQWYLTNLATYSVIYGGIATGIVLLFWAYLLASIFLFSAELCARLNEWLIAEDDYRQAQQSSQRIELYFPEMFAFPTVQADLLPSLAKLEKSDKS
jgi:membrane protein